MSYRVESCLEMIHLLLHSFSLVDSCSGTGAVVKRLALGNNLCTDSYKSSFGIHGLTCGPMYSHCCFLA